MVREPSGDRRAREPQLPRNGCSGHPEATPQVKDQGYPVLSKARAASGGRTPSVVQCAMTAFPVPPEPLVDRANGYAKLLGDPPHGTTVGVSRDDKLSTVDGQTCTLMRVVHPSGSSAGVRRLQPNSEPDEQPTETSQLALRRRHRGPCKPARLRLRPPHRACS